MLIENISPTLNNKHNSDSQKIKTQTASNIIFMNITEDTIISTVKCIYSSERLTWNWMILSWERHRYILSVSFK